MKKQRFIFITAVLILVSKSLFAQLDAQEAFEKGNEEYKSESYEDALELYLLAAESGKSFELYFNLGNTYFKLDSLGKSILYYERAREINSENEDVAINLQIARQQLVDRIEPLPTLGVNNLWEKITSESKIRMYAIITVVGLFISASIYLLMILLRRRKQIITPLRVVFILLLAFSVITFFLGYSAHERKLASKSAVIMASKVDVMSAPENGEAVLFTLHEGTVVDIAEKEGNWVKVKIANGSIGWLTRDALETI